MVPNAVIFSAILSLFVLLSDARLDPLPAAVAVKEPEKSGASDKTVLHVPTSSLITFRDGDDLSRQISHSLRFPLPLNRHRHVPLPHRPVTFQSIEVPYGDDMVGLLKAEKKKKKPRKKEKRDDDDSDSDSDDDGDREIEHKKMKKKEREDKGGILKWISGFVN